MGYAKCPNADLLAGFRTSVAGRLSKMLPKGPKGRPVGGCPRGPLGPKGPKGAQGVPRVPKGPREPKGAQGGGGLRDPSGTRAFAKVFLLSCCVSVRGHLFLRGFAYARPNTNILIHKKIQGFVLELF